MPTPLDVLFSNPDNAPSDGEVPDGKIPPNRAVDRNILIATWNMAHFRSLTRKWATASGDSPKRDYRCLWAITEILSRFDVVAVQEVGADFRALRSAIKVLGPNWSFLMTDRFDGVGNGRRQLDEGTLYMMPHGLLIDAVPVRATTASM